MELVDHPHLGPENNTKVSRSRIACKSATFSLPVCQRIELLDHDVPASSAVIEELDEFGRIHQVDGIIVLTADYDMPLALLLLRTHANPVVVHIQVIHLTPDKYARILLT